MEQLAVRTLFITLRRSFAGTRDSHRGTLKALGLSYRQQTVQQPNTSSVRGAIDTVSAPGRHSACRLTATPWWCRTR